MKVGFIGAGNMATAMIGGMLQKGLLQAEDIIASSATQKTADKVAEQFGIKTTLDNREVAKADIVILAIKPIYCEQVIKEIRDEIREDQIIVTIVAGRSLQWLADTFGKPLKLIRTMPNTPALVGEGCTGVCYGSRVTPEMKEKTAAVLDSFGKTVELPERLMDVLTGVSGCAPAWIFMLIEAMADGAVAEGMPRSQAYECAAQAVLGSAKLMLETGKHPGELKDMVCSPAGSTIQAVRVLEEKGFRGAVTDAVITAVEKSRSL